MNSPRDHQDARRPIASLLSKSQKALQKLAPGTWQHTRLRGNIKALTIASALTDGKSDLPDLKPEDLQHALTALASMISTAEKNQAKFAAGTSSYTLQRNRLMALRTAHELTKAEFDKKRGQ